MSSHVSLVSRMILIRNAKTSGPLRLIIKIIDRSSRCTTNSSSRSSVDSNKKISKRILIGRSACRRISSQK